MCVFFFKQKTAYEMRISDWSSDVCSSDLDVAVSGNKDGLVDNDIMTSRPAQPGHMPGVFDPEIDFRDYQQNGGLDLLDLGSQQGPVSMAHSTGIAPASGRSEEHTSELQSLMRISYAVFCLKKKNNTDRNIIKQIRI